MKSDKFQDIKKCVHIPMLWGRAKIFGRQKNTHKFRHFYVKRRRPSELALPQQLVFRSGGSGRPALHVCATNQLTPSTAHLTAAWLWSTCYATLIKAALAGKEAATAVT